MRPAGERLAKSWRECRCRCRCLSSWRKTPGPWRHLSWRLARASVGRRRWGMSGSWHAELGGLDRIVVEVGCRGSLHSKGGCCCCCSGGSFKADDVELGERRNQPGTRQGRGFMGCRRWADCLVDVGCRGWVQHPPVAFCWSCGQNLLVSSGSELHVKTRSSFSVPRCGLLQQQGRVQPLTQRCIVIGWSSRSSR